MGSIDTLSKSGVSPRFDLWHKKRSRFCKGNGKNASAWKGNNISLKLFPKKILDELLLWLPHCERHSLTDSRGAFRGNVNPA